MTPVKYVSGSATAHQSNKTRAIYGCCGEICHYVLSISYFVFPKKQVDLCGRDHEGTNKEFCALELPFKPTQNDATKPVVT